VPSALSARAGAGLVKAVQVPERRVRFSILPGAAEQPAARAAPTDTCGAWHPQPLHEPQAVLLHGLPLMNVICPRKNDPEPGSERGKRWARGHESPEWSGESWQGPWRANAPFRLPRFVTCVPFD